MEKKENLIILVLLNMAQISCFICLCARKVQIFWPKTKISKWKLLEQQHH